MYTVAAEPQAKLPARISAAAPRLHPLAGPQPRSVAGSGATITSTQDIHGGTYKDRGCRDGRAGVAMWFVASWTNCGSKMWFRIFFYFATFNIVTVGRGLDIRLIRRIAPSAHQPSRRRSSTPFLHPRASYLVVGAS